MSNRSLTSIDKMNRIITRLDFVNGSSYDKSYLSFELSKAYTDASLIQDKDNKVNDFALLLKESIFKLSGLILADDKSVTAEIADLRKELNLLSSSYDINNTDV